MFFATRKGAVCGLIIGALAWAGNALVARASAGMLPPVGLSFWRWVVALALLLPFTLPSLMRHRDVLVVHWPRIALLAALSISSYNTLMYQAAQSTTAINITLVNTGLPVAAFIWSILLLRQWPTRLTLGGTVLSFCGLLLILGRGEPTQVFAQGMNRGDLIMVLAVLTWGLYSVLLRRWPVPLPGFTLLAAMLLFGVPILLPFYLWEVGQGATMPLSAVSVGAVLYTAVMASLVAYSAWNNGVKVLGPGTASLFSYLMPVFASLFGVLLLGEQLHGYHLLGGSLTFAGLVLATWQGRKA